jgi:hypothetical protein
VVCSLFVHGKGPGTCARKQRGPCSFSVVSSLSGRAAAASQHRRRALHLSSPTKNAKRTFRTAIIKKSARKRGGSASTTSAPRAASAPATPIADQASVIAGSVTPSSVRRGATAHSANRLLRLWSGPSLHRNMGRNWVGRADVVATGASIGDAAPVNPTRNAANARHAIPSRASLASFAGPLLLRMTLKSSIPIPARRDGGAMAPRHLGQRKEVRRMRAGTIRALYSTALAILLWVGCGGERPPPQVCPKPVAVDLPDVPEDKRVSAGKACVQDSDCRSGLCDRGICGDPYWRGNYGRECVPGPSPPTDKAEISLVPYTVHITPFGRNLCTGFLCLEGRCRSCQSDAECQWEGSGGPQCLHYWDWPGKRCGTPGEAAPRYMNKDLLPGPTPPPASAPPPKGQ